MTCFNKLDVSGSSIYAEAAIVMNALVVSFLALMRLCPRLCVAPQAWIQSKDQPWSRARAVMSCEQEIKVCCFKPLSIIYS